MTLSIKGKWKWGLIHVMTFHHALLSLNRRSTFLRIVTQRLLSCKLIIRRYSCAEFVQYKRLDNLDIHSCGTAYAYQAIHLKVAWFERQYNDKEFVDRNIALATCFITKFVFKMNSRNCLTSVMQSNCLIFTRVS